MDCNLRAKLNRNELFDESISQVSDFCRSSKNPNGIPAQSPGLERHAPTLSNLP
jgi:hypothetical protein